MTAKKVAQDDYINVDAIIKFVASDQLKNINKLRTIKKE